MCILHVNAAVPLACNVSQSGYSYWVSQSTTVGYQKHTTLKRIKSQPSTESNQDGRSTTLKLHSDDQSTISHLHVGVCTCIFLVRYLSCAQSLSLLISYTMIQ